MSDFDNVKILIMDTNKKFLVGVRNDTTYKYSSLGGGREHGEDVYETMARELNEESSGVLKIIYERKKMFLSDGKNKLKMDIVDYMKDGKKYFILLYVPYDLSKIIYEWRSQFMNNQQKYLFDKVRNLFNRYPEISVIQWLEDILKFKDNYDSSVLKNILRNMGFTKSQINQLIGEFETLGYYLEMDDLDLATYDELKSKYGLYEWNGFYKLLQR
jgi:hypothetical protein